MLRWPGGTIGKVFEKSEVRLCASEQCCQLSYLRHIGHIFAVCRLSIICMLVVESAIDAFVSLQDVRVVHGQEAAVESGFSPADNNTFFGLMMDTFGTIEEARIVTMLPRRPVTVVMLETRMSQKLAERSATQLALEKLYKQQRKLQSQLDCYADSLNTERKFFNLLVPARKTEGNYALESFTVSSVGPSAVVDLHACNDVDQATAYVEDSDAWEFDDKQPDNFPRDFV